MSTLMPKICKCAVCNAENTFMEVTSTNTFGGSPDLDLRPAQMMRGTMPYWIQKCPNCGYVSDEVSNRSSVTRDYLKMDKYLTCNGIVFQSDLAIRFYQQYMICLKDHKTNTAFSAIQRAAWACDDAHDEENAVICRKLAIKQMEALFHDAKLNQDTLRMVRADLLRRAMLYEQLVEEYESVHFSDELLNRILAFEIQKAKEHDPGCYRVEHVTENIA